MIVWAGVLAAGRGSRLGGRPKALLVVGRQTFLETIARTARDGGVVAVAVVLGAHGELVEPVARACCDAVVTNPAPERGMASSAQVVARALPPEASMLLWPVDTPLVTPATVQTLIEASRINADRVIIPVHGGRGHPPLLPPHVVEALRTMEHDARLDHTIESAGGPPVLVDVDDSGVTFDVDIEADLARIRGKPTGFDS